VFRQSKFGLLARQSLLRRLLDTSAKFTLCAGVLDSKQVFGLDICFVFLLTVLFQGARLLSASFDGTARLWEVEGGKLIRK
jgi:hypothetical protein